MTAITVLANALHDLFRYGAGIFVLAAESSVFPPDPQPRARLRRAEVDAPGVVP